MQTLEYQDLLDQIQKQEYPVGKDLQGVKVEVTPDAVQDAVAITIDGRTLLVSRQGARDLALALRQAANVLERRK